jgi:hypothetical protein
MTPPTPLAPAPAFANLHGAESLRVFFARNGYDEQHLYRLLCNPRVPTRGTAEFRRADRLSRDAGPRGLLARLFVLGEPVAQAMAREAFGNDGLEGLLASGMVAAGGGELRPSVALMPYDGLLLAFDSPHLLASGAPSDVVMAISGSSLAVARSAVRARRRRTLDLGTGCGYLALVASEWSDRVVGTDISHRSVAFAEFNAALNGVRNVEFRCGDRFEPVAGEPFDQILSNPPFAILPGTQYLYRDGGGAEPGAFCRDLARGAAAHLEENGVFQMVCDWPQMEGRDADSELRTWFASCPCDVYVLKDETRDVYQYAEEWVQDSEAAVSDTIVADRAGRLHGRGVREISTGYVLMRRGPDGGGRWFHIDDAPLFKSGNFGSQIWRGVQAREFLNATPADGNLLETTLRAAPGLVLRQEAEWHPQGWRIIATRIRQSAGLEREASVDQGMMGLVVRCDGTRPLGEIMVELARVMRAEPEQMIPGTLKMVRELIAQGFLEPVARPVSSS